MVEAAYSALKEVDAVLFMISADQNAVGETIYYWTSKNVHSPVYLIINKIDKIHPDELLGIIEDYSTQMPFAQVIPISATEGNNVERLMDVLVSEMPEGPIFSRWSSDWSSWILHRFWIDPWESLVLTRDEVPHSVAVVVDSMKRNENDKIHIQATIIVERDSQKGSLSAKAENAEASRNESEKDIENL